MAYFHLDDASLQRCSKPESSVNLNESVVVMCTLLCTIFAHQEIDKMSISLKLLHTLRVPHTMAFVSQCQFICAAN